MGGGRRLAAAALRQAGVCEQRRRRLQPAPFPSPSPGGSTQAFPRLQRTLGGGGGGGRAGLPRPGGLAASRTQTAPARHSHTLTLTHTHTRAHTHSLPAGSPCSASRSARLRFLAAATPHPQLPPAGSSWPGEPARRPGGEGGGCMAALRLTSQAASRGARRWRVPHCRRPELGRTQLRLGCRRCCCCRRRSCRCSCSLLLPPPPLPLLHARGPPGGRASLRSLTQAPLQPPH